MQLIVYTVGGIQTQIDNADSIMVRLIDGSLLGIRPGHDRLIGMTNGTDLVYERDREVVSVDAKPGMLVIEKDVVKIFTTT